MNGQKRYEMTVFLREVIIERTKSKGSAYFRAKYKDWETCFCVSDHFRSSRNMKQIISKDKSLKNAKKIAWDLFNGL